MPNFIGIDFGTTRSTVAVYACTDREHKVKKVERPILSIAAINRTSGECYYGIDAQDKITEDYYYIPSLKDLLDKKLYQEFGGVLVTRDSILRGYFEYLKGLAADFNVNEIVLAIPNDFPMKRRSVLRSAAELAGFEIKTFVTEPVAAFFASYSRLAGYAESAILRNCENVAIFDWGGGTLDVTVMQCTSGIVKELAKKRMDCAGNAIDERVAQCVHHWISEKKGKSKSFEDMTSYSQYQMKQFVEEVKINLNGLDDSKTEDTITIPDYDDYGIVTQKITKETFNECIEYIIDDAMEILRKTIEESRLGVGGIDKILLVGGSSKLHLLQKKMKTEYGDKLLISSGDSDWGVAVGAALLSATPGNFMVNQDVSLRLSDGSVFRLIRNEHRVDEYSKAKEFEFGKVDSSSNAVFVFSGSTDIDESADKYLIVKTQALYDDRLVLSVYIDKNMIVHVEGRCDGLPNDKSYWMYTNLSCCYQLPQD